MNTGFVFVIQTYYVSIYSFWIPEHYSFGQVLLPVQVHFLFQSFQLEWTVGCFYILSISSWVLAGNSSLQTLLIQASLIVPGANSACGCGERNSLIIPGMGFCMQKAKLLFSLCKRGNAIKTGYIQQQVLGYSCFFYRIAVSLFLS